ncbi:hypothetical protein [Leptothrix ochracea]|uniref:hypothetical protein n=1 Tax=Leptothrix ochracea TaxID=735331 RepID=UPI0034E1FC22
MDPLLVSLGVPANEIAAERAAMQDWVIGKTVNRRILGSPGTSGDALPLRLGG